MSLPASKFWPLECRKSGYAFGWVNRENAAGGTVIVAGVLSFSDSEVRLLERLEHIQRNVEMAGLGDLKVLGKCYYKFDGDEQRIPVLESSEFEDFTESNVVFYNRYTANTLRFYSMETVRLDIDASDGEDKPKGFKDSSGISEKVVKQLNLASIVDSAVHQPLPSSGFRTTTRIFDLLANTFSIFLSLFTRPILAICNTPIVFSKSLLKDVSLSVQQMDVRAEQLAVLVRQMAVLRSWRSGGRVEVYSVKYTSFFNTLWLILNDVTIGYAFGNFLRENHLVLARLLREVVEDVVISLPQSALRWLDSWPAGLKLNTELSQFCSGTFVDLVDVWAGVLHHIIFPHLHTIIYIFGLISSFGALIGGMGGMTIAIALFYDMFVVFTLHIYVCYAIAEVAYARALWGMGSLWRLFRGKRFNVLRNRTDTWEYDIDQLLFGTILFTLLTFLFPTVLAYYTLFALLRLATIIIQASLEMQLAFMNHFPLFALVLRVKDPWRLPGGVYFDFVKVRRSVPPPSDEKPSSGSLPPVAASTPDIGDSENLKPVEDQVSMLIPIVKNQPVTFGRIFFQYTRLWGHLASHYDPLRLLKLLLLGRFLVPIPRHEIRYDKIGLSPRKHS